MKAKFEGHCTNCNLPIMVGQELERDTKTGKWVHDGCEDKGPFIKPPKRLEDSW